MFFSLFNDAMLLRTLHSIESNAYVSRRKNNAQECCRGVLLTLLQNLSAETEGRGSSNTDVNPDPS